MLLPLILLVIAILSAAVASYGTASGWVSVLESGLGVICLSRRLGWPLWGLCLICCLAVLCLVITGKRRAWWLVGLAPVLVLFIHRFGTDPIRHFSVAEEMPLVKVDGARTLNDSDNVVGVVLGGTPIAYPTAALWRWPVLAQNIYEQKLVLIWNPYANVGRAWAVDRDVTAREMEIVAMPANATLVYNRRYGEFINGVTGRQPSGAEPTGFGRQVPATLTTWGQWRASFPDTAVLTVGADTRVTRPVIPEYEGIKRSATSRPVRADDAVKGPIILIDTHPPIALVPTDVSDTPLNLMTADGAALVVFRDPGTGVVCAYFRDPSQRFARSPDRGFMLEISTGSLWSARGKSLEQTGMLLGRELAPILVSEGGWWQVLREWHPLATIHHVGPEDLAMIPAPPPPPTSPKTIPRRRSPR